MNYVTKTTHELAEGDIVNCHGLRCLIDTEIRETTGHPQNENSPTLWTRSLVLNRDEVPSSHVPLAYTEDFDGNGQRLSHEPRWTIQGNRLATWAVEVA
jgi:hypothetical protein